MPCLRWVLLLLVYLSLGACNTNTRPYPNPPMETQVETQVTPPAPPGSRSRPTEIDRDLQFECRLNGSVYTPSSDLVIAVYLTNPRRGTVPQIRELRVLIVSPSLGKREYAVAQDRVASGKLQYERGDASAVVKIEDLFESGLHGTLSLPIGFHELRVSIKVDDGPVVPAAESLKFRVVAPGK
jgi:hypothetical protein